MRYFPLFLLFIVLSTAPVWSQFAAGDYTELEDTKPRDPAAKWDAGKAPVRLRWGSTDVRYSKWKLPSPVSTAKWSARAWRGERVNAQAVLWTARALDSRFRIWAAGDCFLVYPQRSSIRMERLVEGVQDAEKIRILRKEFAAAGKTKQLEQLNAAVARFTAANLTQTNAGEMVARGRAVLNGF
jgi:hypothetical protein